MKTILSQNLENFETMFVKKMTNFLAASKNLSDKPLFKFFSN